MNVADGIWWSKEDMSNSDANSRVIVRFSRWICLAMVYVAKFSSPITAWRGSIQFLCTHCYDPIHIRKIRIRRIRARKFSAAYSRFKGICLAMVYVAKSHHQLQRGEAVYNFYALIVTTWYISGRYVSEEVVRVNFPRRIPGLKEAPLFRLG